MERGAERGVRIIKEQSDRGPSEARTEGSNLELLAQPVANMQHTSRLSHLEDQGGLGEGTSVEKGFAGFRGCLLDVVGTFGGSHAAVERKCGGVLA